MTKIFVLVFGENLAFYEAMKNGFPMEGFKRTQFIDPFFIISVRPNIIISDSDSILTR